jgi:N-acetylneuraminate synthase
LQCTSEYPCSPENWGLDYISYFKEKFKNIKIGYSDHSGTITSSIAAAALKAEIIEFHVTFDKKMFGPDNLSSLTINEVKKLCAAVRQIKASVNSGFNKFSESNTSEIKNIFSKSLTVNNNFKRNHTIVSEDLETAKPGMMGISPKDYKNILGKKLKRDMEKGDFLNYDDLI